MIFHACSMVLQGGTFTCVAYLVSQRSFAANPARQGARLALAER
ncbi:hypothetical protein ADIMK_0119 [Marinobacterium lacunae]|uniref:Uncharacterized protein n=1 Tax=Marinobacterium lacunae TaxID=1232683 RepID=A0A081G492_9GAMM|nr:hypothetical protein [Marinobacterium lacunae]KEA65597.1 hypothetical protein ADIMK_0119 [Marinobacterium lacunae]